MIIFYKIADLFTNLNFLSALSGLVGTIIIFFFGLPPKIDQEGLTHIITEKIDENEKKKAKRFKKISYFGLLLIALSFLMQLIKIGFNL